MMSTTQPSERCCQQHLNVLALPTIQTFVQLSLDIINHYRKIARKVQQIYSQSSAEVNTTVHAMTYR